MEVMSAENNREADIICEDTVGHTRCEIGEGTLHGKDPLRGWGAVMLLEKEANYWGTRGGGRQNCFHFEKERGTEREDMVSRQIAMDSPFVKAASGFSSAKRCRVNLRVSGLPWRFWEGWGFRASPRSACWGHGAEERVDAWMPRYLQRLKMDDAAVRHYRGDVETRQGKPLPSDNSCRGTNQWHVWNWWFTERRYSGARQLSHTHTQGKSTILQSKSSL